MFRRILVSVVALSLLAGAVYGHFVQGVQAQNCQFSTIEDETGTLNVAEVCAATQQWSSKGVSLYILFTDQTFDNEDDWFFYLDSKETAIGERQGSKVKTDFLAFEATTQALTAITQGDYLFYNTPLNKEVERLKGVLSNGIEAGDPSQAFIDVLNEAYAVAFPPKPAVQPGPVVVVPPQPTSEPVDLKPITNGLKTLFIWGLIGAVGTAFIIFGIVPGGKVVSVQIRKYQHLTNIRQRTTKLLNNLGRLFGKDDIESMLLYQLLKGYGIEKYPKANEEIREWLRRSKMALDEAFMLWKLLEGDKGKKKTVDQLIKAWETIYITLVGNNPDILELTDQQMGQLLDPSAGVDIVGEDELLVEQIRAISKEMVGGGYKITFMLVDPADFDGEGILGYMKQVKDQLEELRRAKAEAAPIVEKAKEVRDEAALRPFPGKLTAKTVFSKVDKLLAEAEQDLSGQLWLTAIRKAEDAIELIQMGVKALPKIIEAESALNTTVVKFQANGVVPDKIKLFGYPRRIMEASLRELRDSNYGQSQDYAEDLLEALASLTTIGAALVTANTAHQERLKIVDGIAKKGFRLPFYQLLIGEVAEDIVKAGENLVKGDYQQADAMVRELTRDSEDLLNRAQALETLYNQNLTDLKQLSMEVARVENYRTSQADLAWQTLCEYPQGNRKDVVEIQVAQNTLEQLFDNPADEKDLVSKIARLNSLQEQQFEKAREELVNAFTRLREAENQLKAIVERLEDVREAEKQAGLTFEQVQTELANTASKRDQYDEYVDADVDKQIQEARDLINRVQGLIIGREFLNAMGLLLQARTILNQALASVDQQSAKILNLLENLEEIQKKAVHDLNQVRVDFANLQPVLQSAKASAGIDGAAQALHKAQAANERLAGLEDRELEKAAQAALQDYRQSLEEVRLVRQVMAQDKSDYDHFYTSAQGAVSKASKAISEARSTMSDSDAGDAGESAFRRATSNLPGVPDYGVSVGKLNEIERQAEQARLSAEQAKSESQAHINAVKEERARRRREEEEQKRREEEERRRRESYTSSSTNYGNSHNSSSWGSSNRTSSFSGSHRSSSSSFGGSRRS